MTPDEGKVLQFAYSRVAPRREELRDLGLGKMAIRLGLTDDHLNGKYCSRCHGLWFGLMLEVECPVCGNRHG